MRMVRLEEALDPNAFGGKAVSLGEALRAGFKVPAGIALDVDCVRALAGPAVAPGKAETETGASPMVGAYVSKALGEGPLAVRSSAVGEDSGGASFAGQHLTRLNVSGPSALLDAIREVWASAVSASALDYRRRMGIAGEPRMAVVIQRLVVPETAGVLFTCDPVTGADERVVEATWGLGEAVVAGLVTPDCWRFRRGGEMLAHDPGEKDVEIIPMGSGTEERPVDRERASRPCLEAVHLRALEELAVRCESLFQGASDIEWAFAQNVLYLLQRRPVTR